MSKKTEKNLYILQNSVGKEYLKIQKMYIISDFENSMKMSTILSQRNEFC